MSSIYNLITNVSAGILSATIIFAVISYVVEPLRGLYYKLFGISPIKDNQDTLFCILIIKLVSAILMIVFLRLPVIKIYLLRLISTWI